MSKKFAKHLPHYFSLFGIIIASVIGMSMFSYDANFQSMIAIAATFGYFSWGMIHHLIHKDLTVFVVMEYLAISLLGLTVILSLIFRR